MTLLAYAARRTGGVLAAAMLGCRLFR